MTVINIPAKSFDYLIGFLWVYNFGLLFKIREHFREDNLKNEIYKKVKHYINSGDIKNKYKF
jgi:hypothetical protein